MLSENLSYIIVGLIFSRLYYHTVTVQPIRPCEIDIDSEAENDPIWLRQKTVNVRSIVIDRD